MGIRGMCWWIVWTCWCNPCVSVYIIYMFCYVFSLGALTFSATAFSVHFVVSIEACLPASGELSMMTSFADRCSQHIHTHSTSSQRCVDWSFMQVPQLWNKLNLSSFYSWFCRKVPEKFCTPGMWSQKGRSTHVKSVYSTMLWTHCTLYHAHPWRSDILFPAGSELPRSTQLVFINAESHGTCPLLLSCLRNFSLYRSELWAADSEIPSLLRSVNSRGICCKCSENTLDPMGARQIWQKILL